MVLITGGAFQGKLDYALEFTGYKEEQVIDGEFCEWEELYSAKIINHFHLMIKRMMEKELEVRPLVEKLIQLNPNVIVIVNELGCGIIPLDSFDRMYREMTGRICCTLAKGASQVHRVTCGIGTVIKNA